MWRRLFASRSQALSGYVVAQLNARLQPLHRGEYFEDPLDAELRKAGYGEVSGGGTLQDQVGEIEYCDIEVLLKDAPPASIDLIVATLERLGAPKGSKLHIEPESRELALGTAEGLAIYLNGTDLPDDVYRSCDPNVVYDEFNRLLGSAGRVLSYWQGPRETALYLYGTSCAEMQSRIVGFLATYPLCQRSRTVQIA